MRSGGNLAPSSTVAHSSASGSPVTGVKIFPHSSATNSPDRAGEKLPVKTSKDCPEGADIITRFFGGLSVVPVRPFEKLQFLEWADFATGKIREEVT